MVVRWATRLPRSRQSFRPLHRPASESLARLLQASRPRSGAFGVCRGSVLVIVLWIAFGLVSMALYFGQSMLFEFRASEQNAAGVQAEQAIEGAARYLSYALTNAASLGHLPDTNYFGYEAVPVGEAAFWSLVISGAAAIVILTAVEDEGVATAAGRVRTSSCICPKAAT